MITKNKILRIVIYVIIGVLVLYNAVIILQKITNPNKVPNFFGYKKFVVITGSMEPTINIGDIIITKETKELKVGDIISFSENGYIVTHRIIQKVEENGKIKYRTKGDANNTEDIELVSQDNIEGKYKFKIPIIGKIIVMFNR